MKIKSAKLIFKTAQWSVLTRTKMPAIRHAEEDICLARLLIISISTSQAVEFP
jgi:hypothetical protein